MNVVRFPVVPKLRPGDEPFAIMAGALAHMEQLVAIYREVGSRPNPVTILMMIASILDEPELRRAAGFDAPEKDKPSLELDDLRDNPEAENVG